MDKPEKPNAVLPSSFGGIKAPFSTNMIKNGFEPDVKQLFQGDNLNDWLDKTGKKFEYIEKIVDFVNELPIDNIITTDENNKIVYFNKNEFALDSLTAKKDLGNTVGNLSQEASNFFSGLSMPSERYIDLSLGNSGSTYTAPSNGYFYIAKKGNLGQYVSLRIEERIKAISPRAAASMCYLEYAVKKGDEVKCVYDLSGETTVFRFYYAQGVQE